MMIIDEQRRIHPWSNVGQKEAFFTLNIATVNKVTTLNSHSPKTKTSR